MSRIFTYTSIEEVGEVCGSIEEFGEKFDYEVKDDELLTAVAYMIWSDYFYMINCDKTFLKETISKFISDNDLLDNLVDIYEENLKDYFESEALSWYRS